MPGVDGFEEETESEGPLDPSKWRQNGVNGWRLDLDIELFDNFYGNDDDLVDSRKPREYVSGKGDPESEDSEEWSSSPENWDDNGINNSGNSSEE